VLGHGYIICRVACSICMLILRPFLHSDTLARTTVCIVSFYLMRRAGCLGNCLQEVSVGELIVLVLRDSAAGIAYVDFHRNSRRSPWETPPFLSSVLEPVSHHGISWSLVLTSVSHHTRVLLKIRTANIGTTLTHARGSREPAPCVWSVLAPTSWCSIVYFTTPSIVL
jgi:hypothetical protein